MPRLVIYPRTPLARELQLKPGENFIGRAFANDLRLEDASVSGSHCQIIVNGASATIRDLGSTNGTYLDRVQVREAALLPGQTLHLGGVEVLFKADSGTQPIGRVSGAGASPLPPSQSRSAVAASVAAPAIAAAAPSSAFAPIGQLASVPGVPPLSAAATASATAPTTFLSRADIPPPRPSPGLRPAALAAQQPDPAPAVPVAAPVPGAAGAGVVFEAPAGKTACKFHPKTAGNWLCQKCSELYCSVCVSPRPLAAETGFFCRKCGTQCVAVKPNFVPPREKVITEYSDAAVLMRSIAFGSGAAVGMAALWILLAWSTHVQVPYLACWATGGACGYAVKIGCQDRPSIVFSLIAVFSSLFGILIGIVGSTFAMGMLYLGSVVYLAIGIVAAIFTAWKVGGGDF
jgi:pSer/pThr/pTyr-binding forkhead associated (FHA) protein